MGQWAIQFEETIFLQSHGTSMGSAFAPSVAGLYVHSVEMKKILNSGNPYFTNIITWKRYIDDIFIIRQGTSAEVALFMLWFNNIDPHLRFTHTVSNESLIFLDLEIQVDNNKLVTVTHYKPMARNTLLHFNSFHPRTLKENLPF